MGSSSGSKGHEFVASAQAARLTSSQCRTNPKTPLLPISAPTPTDKPKQRSSKVQRLRKTDRVFAGHTKIQSCKNGTAGKRVPNACHVAVEVPNHAHRLRPPPRSRLLALHQHRPPSLHHPAVHGPCPRLAQRLKRRPMTACSPHQGRVALWMP